MIKSLSKVTVLRNSNSDGDDLLNKTLNKEAPQTQRESAVQKLPPLDVSALRTRELERRLKQMIDRNVRLTSENELLSKRAATLEHDVSHWKRKCSAGSGDLATIEHQLSAKHEHLINIQNDLTHSQQEYHAIRKNNSSLKKQNQTFQDSNNELHQRLELFEKEWTSRENSLQQAYADFDNERINHEKASEQRRIELEMSFNSKLSDLNVKISLLSDTIKEKDEQITQLKIDQIQVNELLKAKEETFKKNLEDQTLEIKSLDAELKTLTSLLEQQKIVSEELNEELGRYKTEMNEMVQTTNEAKAKLIVEVQLREDLEYTLKSGLQELVMIKTDC